MRSTVRLLSAMVLSALGVAAPLEAQASPAWIGWQFQGENDAIAGFSGSDEQYTNGIRFTFQRHPESLRPGTVALGERIWKRLHPHREVAVGLGWEFGQHLFTPGDLRPSALIPDDRPYAGWLYGGAVLTLTEDDPGRDDLVQQTLEIQLGIVGPEAGGEWVQTELHELIGSELPMGWDHQLPFEIGLNAFYTWRRRFVLGRLGGHPSFDVVPHLSGALGTMQIYAGGGVTVRFGRHISGFPLMQNHNTIVPQGARPPWEGYVFAGAEGRAIARNIFLDGSTFEDSHSVDKESFVYDLEAGFSVRYRSCRLSYTFIRRSREFSPPPQGRPDGSGRHDYGSINFTVERSF